MHRLFVAKVWIGVLVLAVFGFSIGGTVQAGAGESWSSFGTTFIHKATPANTSCGSNHCTIIDHPLTNDNPSAILFVTQVWKEKDSYIPNPTEVGVFYKNGKWGIINEDKSAMPEDRAFNVQVMSEGPRVFKHEVTLANRYPFTKHVTMLEHTGIHDSPFRHLLVTRNHGTTLNNASLFPHEVGVWYDNNLTNWTIFSEDKVDMPIGLVYNVQWVSAPASVAFTWVTSEDNVDEATPYRTMIESPILNNNSNAIIQVTQSFTVAGDDTNKYNPHEIGLYYVIGEGRWVITNQDGADMPLGAAFNIYVSDTGLDYLGQSLLNGSFEVQSVNAKTPAAWKVVNGNGKAGANNKARRLCPGEGGLAVAFKDHCALQLKGGAVNQNVSQNLPKTGVDADYTVSLEAYVEGVNLTPGSASIRVIATYAGGQKQTIKVPAASLNDGTYDYKYVSAMGVLTQKPKKLTVKISMLGGAGSRLRVDAMHIYVYPGLVKAEVPAAPTD